MSGEKFICLICAERPVREPLVDQNGERATIGYLTCSVCARDKHAGLCNDPNPHDAPHGCSRDTRRPKCDLDAIRRIADGSYDRG